MAWIYISPHLDDVALSCGGLVWEQARAGGPVSVWTICAGDPPQGPFSPFAESLHKRWGTGKEAVAHRRLEDAASCKQMGAFYLHFSIPDCIYRNDGERGASIYDSEESLFGDVHPSEAGLIQRISDGLAEALSRLEIRTQPFELVCPLAIGGHVDHRLTRAAVEGLLRRSETIPGLARHLWFYTDYPYVAKSPEVFKDLQEAGWNPHVYPVSQDGMDAWERAVAAHASQIGSFWPDAPSMHAALRAYRQQQGGVRLWQAPPHRS